MSDPLPVPAITVTVAGSAQDGGVPQIWCQCPNCTAARRAGTRRYAASLVVEVAGARGVAGADVVAGDMAGSRARRLLVDAGPDLRVQIDSPALGIEPAGRHSEADARRIDAVALTHLHTGHYFGLAEFGREVANTRGLPLYCTPKVAAALTANVPWRFLIEQANLSLRPLAPGAVCEPFAGLTLVAVEVPHRNEVADTVGFVLRRAGAARGGALYIPDADRWAGIIPALGDLVASVDVALLDGTFYSHGELGATTGRDGHEVPHPPVPQTLDLLGDLAARVILTHLNHTNPLLRPDSPESLAVARRGARIAVEGLSFSI